MGWTLMRFVFLSVFATNVIYSAALDFVLSDSAFKYEFDLPEGTYHK